MKIGTLGAALPVFSGCYWRSDEGKLGWDCNWSPGTNLICSYFKMWAHPHKHEFLDFVCTHWKTTYLVGTFTPSLGPGFGSGKGGTGSCGICFQVFRCTSIFSGNREACSGPNSFSKTPLRNFTRPSQSCARAKTYIDMINHNGFKCLKSKIHC